MGKIEKATENRSVFASKLFQFLLVMVGFKSRMDRNIVKDKYRKTPAKIPRSFERKNTVKVSTIDGRIVWNISPKSHHPEVVVIYLHGGAYFSNLTLLHWPLIAKLLEKTGAKIIVPDYPLAPKFTCTDTYTFLDKLHDKVLEENPAKRIVFVGDSAGGGLAMGFAQQLRNEGKTLPDHLILYSPWLDASMTDPNLKKLEKTEKVLSLKGLKKAGEKYAGSHDIKNFRVSPLYGNLKGLGKISIFTATHEMLNADAKRFKEKAIEAGIYLNYFEYRGLFHCWVLVPFLGATQDVVQKTARLIKTC